MWKLRIRNKKAAPHSDVSVEGSPSSILLAVIVACGMIVLIQAVLFASQTSKNNSDKYASHDTKQADASRDSGTDVEGDDKVALLQDNANKTPSNPTKNIERPANRNTAWLGVMISNRPKTETGEQPAGAIIKEVLVGSPADKGEFRKDDIILQIQQAWVANANDVMNEISKYPPGRPVLVFIERDGNTFYRAVKLGEKPANLQKDTRVRESPTKDKNKLSETPASKSLNELLRGIPKDNPLYKHYKNYLESLPER